MEIQDELIKTVKFRPQVGRWIHGIAVVLGGLVAISAVVGGAYSLAYWRKILPGVEIAGINVSNMSGEEAANLIQKQLSDGLKTIKVVSGEKSWEFVPSEVGLETNLPATINQAWEVGRKGGLLERLGQAQTSYFNGKNIPLVIKVDEEKMKLKLAEVESELNQDAELPAVIVKTVNKERIIEVSTGRNGLEVEAGVMKRVLINKWALLQQENIEVPLTVRVVEVNKSSTEKTKIEAEKLLNKELVMKLDDDEWKFNDEELIGLIKVGEIVSFDDERVRNLVADFALVVNRLPENAAFSFEDGKVKEFRASKDGVEVKEDKVVKQIIESYSSLLEREKVELATEVKRTAPKIKTEDVNDLGIRELLGKGESTFFHSIPNRVHNVALAASRIAGTLVAPGEEFSFNQVIGDISASTGYKTAYVISGGRTILGDGGGVCQVSTTLFRAALKSGFPITERKAHAYRVGYYEQDSLPGVDATVYSPTADFKFRNDTQAHILIQPKIDTKNYYLSFEIYGTSDGREVTITKPKIWAQTPALPTLYQDDPTLEAGVLKQVDWSAPGAKTSFDYRVTRNGEKIFEKTFVSTYRAWQAVYLRGTRI